MNRTFKDIKNDPKQEYDRRRAEIEELLKQIKSGLAEHARNANKDAARNGLHWGHVGDLDGIADTLRDFSDRLHGTGEYAS